MKDLLSVSELEISEIRAILELADAFKNDPFAKSGLLKNQVVVELYAKPSTRTRLSFAAAVNRLGGSVEVVSGNDLQLGRGETIEDTARSISRYAAAFIIRTHDHAEVTTFADSATIPVINALTRLHHPLQALADAQTIQDKLGTMAGIQIGYVGDGNNVANSLIELAAYLGAHIRVATPVGHEPDAAIVKLAQTIAQNSGGTVDLTNDPEDAVRDAQVVYTDVWTSMGESKSAADIFDGFQVNEQLLKLADNDAIFMHCLPAHRGEEVTDEVVDGPQSVVFDQAENRMHTAQSVLAHLVLNK